VIPIRPVQLGGNVVAAACTIGALGEEPVHAADLEGTGGLMAPRRSEYLASRALLRWLIAEVVGTGAAVSPLCARPGGQPYLMERPDVAISISHTEGWVAVAVHTEGAVGIDAQCPLPVSEGLLRRCCTTSARTALLALPNALRDVEFAWIWAVQEACVKATGAGIRGRPWRIPVEVGQHDGDWHAIRWWALRDTWQIPIGCAHTRATA
jgi:4'-phosphopantetheinyl transferase